MDKAQGHCMDSAFHFCSLPTALTHLSPGATLHEGLEFKRMNIFLQGGKGWVKLANLVKSQGTGLSRGHKRGGTEHDGPYHGAGLGEGGRGGGWEEEELGSGGGGARGDGGGTVGGESDLGGAERGRRK